MEQNRELTFEGVLRVCHSNIGGTHVLVACSSWVIHYGNASDFEAFADRRVTVSGIPGDLSKSGPTLFGAKGTVWHSRASAIGEVLPGARLVELGARQAISWRFERAECRGEKPALVFVTDTGGTLPVLNDPDGMTAGDDVRATVRAHLVRRSASPEDALWIDAIIETYVGRRPPQRSHLAAASTKPSRQRGQR